MKRTTPEDGGEVSIVAVDVLVICALKDEYDQVLEVREGILEPGWIEHRGGSSGWTVADAKFTTSSGNPLIVRASWASHMGRETAQAVTSKLINDSPARCIAMSGICAGRRDKVALGDVIFAERLWSYDAGKTTVENGNKKFQGDMLQYNPKPVWVQRMQSLTIPSTAPWLTQRPALTLEQQEDWVLRRLVAGENPLDHCDFKTACPDWESVALRLQTRKWLDASLDLTPVGRDRANELKRLNPQDTPIHSNWIKHVAPMATGAEVTEDPGIFERLADSMRKVLGVDMEASALGAFGAVYEIPFIVAKGVQDYGDQFKDTRYRNFAARAAAECLIALLREAADLLPQIEAPAKTDVVASTVLHQTTEPNILSGTGLLENPFTQAVADGSDLSLEFVSIGILTSSPMEYAAVCTVLNCNKETVAIRDGGDKVYRLGVVGGRAGKFGLVVAVALTTSMGSGSVVRRVACMLTDCRNLKELIVCGIAGAMPNPTKPEEHVRLGDIVVSVDGVIDCDVKQSLNDGAQTKESFYSASNNLAATTRDLQAGETLGRRPWEKYIESYGQGLSESEGFRRPPLDTDLLSEANWGNPIQLIGNVTGWVKTFLNGSSSYLPIPHPCDRKRRLDQPRVFCGLIASANRAPENQGPRERLRKRYPAIRAMEGEAAGAAHACNAEKVGYFMVLGTCSYCNGPHNKVWENYAALVAAAYTRSLVETLDVRVLSDTSKLLTVVLVDGTLAGTQGVPSDIGGLQVKDKHSPASRTSEGIREIPRLSPLVRGDQSKPAISAFRAALATDMSTIGTALPPLHEYAESFVSHLPIENQAHVETIAQPSERERQLLTDEGERQIGEMKELLDRWEFESAFRAATLSADWITKNQLSVTTALVSQMYATLARIEATKAKQSRESGKAVDLKLARHYLDKARDASTQ